MFVSLVYLLFRRALAVIARKHLADGEPLTFELVEQERNRVPEASERLFATRLEGPVEGWLGRYKARRGKGELALEYVIEDITESGTPGAD